METLALSMVKRWATSEEGEVGFMELLEDRAE
jgi:hypothetical protein